jgi:hypothetical protein
VQILVLWLHFPTDSGLHVDLQSSRALGLTKAGTAVLSTKLLGVAYSLVRIERTSDMQCRLHRREVVSKTRSSSIPHLVELAVMASCRYEA